MSHARVSAHVLNIVLYPAAAEPLPRPNWNVAGVCERVRARTSLAASDGRTDGRTERQGGEERRKEGG